MPRIRVHQPDGSEIERELLEALVSVGTDAGNDVVLQDPGLAATALHLEKRGDGYQAIAHGESFRIGGRARDEHELRDGDALTVGRCRLVYTQRSGEPAAARPPAPDAERDAPSDRDALRRLTALAELALQSAAIDSVLERLLDEAIALTRADHGSLLLLDEGVPRVRFARGAGGGLHSESIVRKVIESGQPLRLDHALEHPEFGAARSVVDLKLLSVLCVPLPYRGQIFGVLWVGNERLTHRFGPSALELLTLFAAQASLLVQNAILRQELELESTLLKRKLEAQRYGGLVGSAPGMREVYRRVDKVAGTDLSVLIEGETGTGKELIARELHQRSSRAKGPFIGVNCGAIPENLLESELFGHVRGAFTGAVTSRVGRFQAASAGTLFLDEIGDLPLALQVKLLRALEEKVVHRVGETRGEPVDIRIVAATNRQLGEEVRAGRFREDLYYRLNVVAVSLPPLRERGDDILLMATFFLHRFAEEYHSRARAFSPAAQAALRRHKWPGNVRELENRIKKAVVLGERPLLSADDLDLGDNPGGPVVPLAQAKEEFQQRYIDEVLARNGGNRTKTARDLGVDPRTVFRHLERREPGDSETEEGEPGAV